MCLRPQQSASALLWVVQISRVSEIDCQKGTFSADVMVEATWKDPNAGCVHFTPEWVHWSPGLSFENLVEAREDRDEYSCVDGLVTMHKQVDGGRAERQLMPLLTGRCEEDCSFCPVTMLLISDCTDSLSTHRSAEPVVCCAAPATGTVGLPSLWCAVQHLLLALYVC